MDATQKKTAIIGAIVLVFIIAVLALWYMATHEPKPLPTGEVPVLPGTPAAQEKATVTDRGTYYDAEVSYPRSTPLAASAGRDADAAAVHAMKTFAEGQIAAFKERSGLDQLSGDDIEMIGLSEDRKYALDIDYEVKESPVTITYIYTLYEDTLGAHPNAYLRTFTFNKKTGEEVHLDEILTGNYLERLSQLSRQKLAASIEAASGYEPNMEYIESGTLPIADSFQNFYLEADALVLMFPPYQVGPYALGLQTARIPKAELGATLNTDYR